MRLRPKTFLIIASVFLVLVTSLLLISRHLVAAKITEMEAADVQMKMTHALGKIDDGFSQLQAISGDWGRWDDTYEFMQNRSPEYVKANLSDEALDTLGVNFMLFVDRDGKVLFAKAIDLTGASEVKMPSHLRDAVAASATLLDHPDPVKSRSGYLMQGDTAVVVASSAVLRSDLSGSPQGSLVVGKFLDAPELQRLSEALHLSVQIIPMNRDPLPPVCTEALSLISDQHPVAVMPGGEDTVSGYTVQKDIDGRPAFLLRIDTDRKLANEGLASLLYFSLAVAVLGLIFIGTTMLLLEKSVLSPLLTLSRQVGSIGTQNEDLQRVAVPGGDEVGDLAAAINSMLDRIETAGDTIRTLEGLIPICSYCKKLRNDTGFWQKVEEYVGDHAPVQFSHGICPECAEKQFPEYDLYEEEDSRPSADA